MNLLFIPCHFSAESHHHLDESVSSHFYRYHKQLPVEKKYPLKKTERELGGKFYLMDKYLMKSLAKFFII